MEVIASLPNCDSEFTVQEGGRPIEIPTGKAL